MGLCVADDAYADRFLDEVAHEVDRLADQRAVELPDMLRPIVRRTLLTIRPDGSWPDPLLLQEALRAYVDLVDMALVEQNVELAELDREDRRWLEACRQSTESIELLEDMLFALRADVPAPGPSTTR